MRGANHGEETSPGPSGADLSHEEALEMVRRALSEISYGSILITVHQGEVVGLEIASKVRLKKES